MSGCRFTVHAAVAGLCTAALVDAAWRCPGMERRLLTTGGWVLTHRSDWSRAVAPNSDPCLHEIHALLDRCSSTHRDSPGSMAEERCIRVVVFSDVVDSTGRMFRDEASAVQQIQADLSGFEQQILRHGGTLIKFTGDGILATFDTTSRALAFIEAAVLGLQGQEGSSLQHRFGLHLGEIYQKGDDILGQGVHLAARLQTISPANGVAFTEATHANLDSGFRSRAVRLGALELKGISGRIRCYAIEERALLPADRRTPTVRRLVLRGDALRRRLVSSQRRQAIAAGLALLLGLIADLDASNPLSAYLLDRRLHGLKAWRQLTAQPGPMPVTVPVLLLRSRSQPVSRRTLADLLTALPPSRFPAVALDYVLDAVGPDPAAMERLVEVIRSQRRPQLLVGFFGARRQDWIAADSAGADAGDRSRPISALRQAGIEERDLTLGTAAGGGPIQPRPLQLLVALTDQQFAAALATAIRPQLPPALRGAAAGIPAEAVIDWSLDWGRGIRVLNLDGIDPPRPPAVAPAPLLVVGSHSDSRQPDADLFRTPAAFRRADPAWDGSASEMPGVIAQVVVGQSLALGHWLTPLSASACAALAAGLGVVAAAALPAAGQRLRLLALAVPIGAVVGLQVAVAGGVLIPFALPSLSLAGTCLLRRES